MPMHMCMCIYIYILYMPHVTCFIDVMLTVSLTFSFTNCTILESVLLLKERRERSPCFAASHQVEKGPRPDVTASHLSKRQVYWCAQRKDGARGSSKGQQRVYVYIYIDICTYLHNSYLSNSVCVSMGHIRMYMSLCSVTSTKQAFIAQGDWWWACETEPVNTSVCSAEKDLTLTEILPLQVGAILLGVQCMPNLLGTSAAGRNAYTWHRITDQRNVLHQLTLHDCVTFKAWSVFQHVPA